MKHTFATTLLVVLLGLSAGSDLAGQPFWATPGAGCVPTDAAIQSDLYLITGGRIKFKPGAVGSITVMCPVSVAGVEDVGSLGLSYRVSFQPDPSDPIRVQVAKAQGNRISAALRRIRKTDGDVVTLQRFEFSSHMRGDNKYVTEYTYYVHSPSCSETSLDHKNNYYWIQVVLRRTDPNVIVEFGGVDLGVSAVC